MSLCKVWKIVTTWLSERKKEIREFYRLNVELWCCERCLNRSNWLPPEAPHFCNSKPSIYRSRICCDKDFCNLNLYPVLLSPDSELSSGIFSRARDHRRELFLSLIRVYNINVQYIVYHYTLTPQKSSEKHDFRNNQK